MGMSRHIRLRHAQELSGDLMDAVADQPTYHSFLEAPASNDQIKSLTCGLYLCALEGARDSDKAEQPEERVLENIFYAAVDELAFKGYAPFRVKGWIYDNPSPDMRAERADLRHVGYMLQNPAGVRENLLKNGHDKALAYKDRHYPAHRAYSDIPWNPVSYAFELFERTLQTICPLQQRDARIKAELQNKQMTFDKMHRHNGFAHVPLIKPT